MTRSRNSSRAGSPVCGGGAPVRRGGSPVRRCASPVRGGDDDDDSSGSPSPLPRKSRGRMQTPSAAAKSDSPPRGRTMTRSASRAASRGCSPKAAADTVKIVADAVAAHYQPLDAKYPDRVRAPSVSRRGYRASSPDFSSSRLVPASAKRDKSVERNTVRRSERISSRAPSVDPSARVGIPRVRSAARGGASSGESSSRATLPTPGKWDSPASTDEVLTH